MKFEELFKGFDNRILDESQAVDHSTKKSVSGQPGTTGLVRKPSKKSGSARPMTNAEKNNLSKRIK